MHRLGNSLRVGLAALLATLSACIPVTAPTVDPTPTATSLPEVLTNVEVLAPLTGLSTYRVILNMTIDFTGQTPAGAPYAETSVQDVMLEVEQATGRRHARFYHKYTPLGGEPEERPADVETYFVDGTIYLMLTHSRGARCATIEPYNYPQGPGSAGGTGSGLPDPGYLLGGHAHIPEARLVARGELVAGQPADHYHVQLEAGPEHGPVEADIWVTPAEGYVVRYTGAATFPRMQALPGVIGEAKHRFEYRLEQVNSLPAMELPADCVGALPYEPQPIPTIGAGELTPQPGPAPLALEPLIVLSSPGRALAALESYLYVGLGDRLAVLDTADPGRPAVVSQGERLPGHVDAIAIAGRTAYVTLDKSELRTFDLSDPAAPRALGSLALAEPGAQIVLAEPFAYLVLYQSLQVVDVSDPAQPRARGSYAFGAFGPSPSPAQLAVAGPYAYLATGGRGLVVLDVSNPDDIREVGADEAGQPAPAITPEGLTLLGGYLYLGYVDRDNFTDGTRIYDVRDPLQPVLVDEYDRPLGSLTVAGRYAYAPARGSAGQANSQGGLQVLDVLDPAHPVGLGRVETPEALRTVVVAGGTVYVMSERRGLLAIDATDPLNPQRIGGYPTPSSAIDVVADGGYAYVSAPEGLYVLDVAEPERPVVLSMLPLDSGRGYAALATGGGYVYVANPDSGVHIVDVADPAAPAEVANYVPPDQARGITLVGQLAYVAAGRAGLRVLDVSEPARPQEIGSLGLTGDAWAVAVAGPTAYVAATDGGLHVVDVADPRSPQRLATLPPPMLPEELASYYDVAVAGDYAFVAADRAGLRLIDVSSPTQPREAGMLLSDQTPAGVTLAGSWLIVGAPMWGGVDVLDVSDPAQPRLIGVYSASARAESAVVIGETIYVADAAYGLLVLRAP